MLSIIISSYQPSFFSALEKNIADTCGIVFEIIKVENPGTMSICEAYNLGAKKAHFNYLLFLHEDVLFHTQNWGKLLIKHLNIENVGVVGVAGSDYVPIAPCGWNVSHKHNIVNIIQSNKTNSNRELIQENISSNGIPKKAFAIDGVFLAVNKSVYQKHLFPIYIKGFHAYDLYFSLKIAQNHNNFIISDILIEHFSKGNIDKQWVENNIKVRDYIKFNFNPIRYNEIETNVFLSFIGHLFTFKGIDSNTLLTSFLHYPFRFCTFPDHIKIIKHFFYYIRFYKSFNKKYIEDKL